MGVVSPPLTLLFQFMQKSALALYDNAENLSS